MEYMIPPFVQSSFKPRSSLSGSVFADVALKHLTVIPHLLDDVVGPFFVKAERFAHAGRDAQKALDIGVRALEHLVHVLGGDPHFLRFDHGHDGPVDDVIPLIVAVAYDWGQGLEKNESLDRELDTFLEAFREMNEIKGSIADLPDKIKKHETDLADRKMEIEKLLTATSNTLMDFEERSKGLLFDLEKRTEALALKTKPGHANDIETPATQLSDEQMARIDQIIKSYEQILTSFESYRDMLDSHEESLHVLKNRQDDI